MGRTLLLGLDGATYSVLDPLMEEGVMPYLASVVEGGVRAVLRSTVPALSPVAWTSLSTGREPGDHGVFDFIRAVERNGEVYFTLYNAQDIKTETIWSMASRQGRRVTLLNYMLTFPTPPVDGYVVPGLVSWKHLRRGTHPPQLFETLKSLLGSGYREMAWDFDLEKEVLRGVDQDRYEDWIRFHTTRESHWFEVARHLLEVDPCDLFALVFDGIDKIQHACWRFLDPELAPARASGWEARIADLCRAYFNALDGYLEELVRLAGPDARVFFVSDHGFGPTREAFRVNVWLHEQGYLEWNEPHPTDEASKDGWKRRLDSNFALLDWKRTTAYARTPSSNGIFIRQSDDPADAGVRPEDYETFRRQLMDGLTKVESPLTGRPVVQRILTREQAFPGTQTGDAPDLFLELADHGFISIRNALPVVEVRQEVSGTHRPDGIFLAQGPGIRRGTEVEALPIAGVAPLLLHSLDLGIPDEMGDELRSDVFDASWLASNPGRGGGWSVPQPQADSTADGNGLDPQEEAAVFERLRALGYVE